MRKREVQPFNWDGPVKLMRQDPDDAQFGGRVHLLESTMQEPPAGLYVIEALFTLYAADKRGLGPVILEIDLPKVDNRFLRVNLTKDPALYAINMFHRHKGGDMDVDLVCTGYGFSTVVLGTRALGQTGVVVNHAFG